MAGGWCSNCGGGAAWRRGLCSACYLFERRTGRARPEELAVRAAVRDFDRSLEREAGPVYVPVSQAARLRARADEATRERAERLRGYR